jgi:protocatechuate 3,4-dioxygenase beta subunit
MNASRSLIAVLLLVLAAAAWFLLRDGSAPSTHPASTEATGADAASAGAPPVAGAGLASDESLQRAETSAPQAAQDALARAAAAAAGQATIRLRAVDPQGRPVADAWLASRVNPFGDADFAFAPGTSLEDGERPRVAGGADGRVDAPVPADAALSVEVGGSAQQSRTLRLDPLARGEVLDLGEFVLQDGGAIAGRVVAPDGTAVADAQVSLREAGSRGPFGGGAQRRATTDARGEYRFGGLAPGGYELEADASGFAPAAGVRVAATAGARPAEAVLELREGRVVRGQVVDVDRRPVAGAEIFVAPASRGGAMVIEFGGGGPSRQQEAEAVSGPDGRFLLRGLPEEGSARLTARAQGHASGRATVAAGTDEVLFTLTPALTLAGTLVNEKGAPVPGVEVAVERADDEFDLRGFWSERSAVSGPDGAFAIAGLDAGLWRVVAHTATHSVRELLVDLARDVDDVVARLEPAAVLAVTVTDAAGGAPVAGALVLVEPREEANPSQGEFRREVRVRGGTHGVEVVTSGEDRAITDAAGVAAFDAVTEGAYRLRISADGFARQSVDLVRERGAQRAEVALLPGADLRASVLDGAGAPLPGVRVVARPQPEGTAAKAPPLTRTTDASGRAVFTGMQPGVWIVDYEAAALEGNFRVAGLPGAGRDVAASSASSRTGVEAVLVPGVDAEVILRATEIAIPTVRVTRRGKPLVGAQVRLEAAAGEDDGLAMPHFGGASGVRTLADGRARLQPVAPGKYEVVIVPGGGLPERRERAELLAGEQMIEVDVRGGRIAGRAESTSGELRNAVAHLERAQVEATDGGPRRPTGLAIMVTDSGDGPNVVMSGGPDATRAEVDSAGRFAFEEVPPGEWTVRITAPGHAAWTSARIAITGEQEHDVGSARLSAGGTLRGVHRGALAGASTGGFGGSLLILLDEQGRQAGMTQPGTDGSFQFRDLASGAYVLLAPPGYRSDPIEVRDGATVTHDVPAER